MKYILLFIPLFYILSSCSSMDKNSENIEQYPLNSNWSFKQTTSSNWLPATVPGTVHTDLLENEIIEDPYYRVNEKDLQWVDKVDWEYKCEFEPAYGMLDKDKVELAFDGVDTYADVYLNDVLILQTDNMFKSWKVECKEYIHKGANTLRVVLKSPINIGLEKLEANGFPLPASNDQSENGEMGDKKVSIFTRKAGYHYGWDWGPRLVTSGIWRPVNLVAFNTAKIVDTYFVQNSLTEEKASVTTVVEIEALRDFDAELKVNFGEQELTSEKITALKGQNVYQLHFNIPNPELWWPNGLGEQNLYHIKVSLLENGNGRLIDTQGTTIGLRTIQLVREKDKDGDGEGFYFEVNGNPVFAKGANYIPNDVFLTRFSPGDYERIVKDAAEANMNMLRVWGGGVYENDVFYDLCDKYGIMVWQDFMYACSMYPGDDQFLENARIEAEENIRRLRNHPSIVLWCGNNEIEVAWGEYEEDKGWGWKQRYSADQRKVIWKSYDTLFHHILPQAVKEYDPQVNYWHSSPSAGMGKLAGYESNAGDMHYWGVWHGQHPFSDFRVYRARFMSEYGFQSFPELNTVAAYALPDEWDIESEVMAAHQRSGIGNLRIRQYMEDDYRIPEDFNQFLYVSQLLQAEGIKMAIKSHRAEMPYCMGSLYWQLNDCWPVASWSGIDYYGRWKALHYFVKHAFENTIVANFQDESNVSVWIVSDQLREREGILELRFLDFNGNVLKEVTKKVVVPGNNAANVFSVSLTEAAGVGNLNNTFLQTNLVVGGKSVDSELHYFVNPKNLKLEEPELKIELNANANANAFEISISSKKLAKNVFLSTDISLDHFSDNYFDVIPGQTVKITFPKICSLAEFEESLKVVFLNQTMN